MRKRSETKGRSVNKHERRGQICRKCRIAFVHYRNKHLCWWCKKPEGEPEPEPLRKRAVARAGHFRKKAKGRR